jgi:hypothetical protein
VALIADTHSFVQATYFGKQRFKLVASFATQQRDPVGGILCQRRLQFAALGFGDDIGSQVGGTERIRLLRQAPTQIQTSPLCQPVSVRKWTIAMAEGLAIRASTNQWRALDLALINRVYSLDRKQSHDARAFRCELLVSWFRALSEVRAYEVTREHRIQVPRRPLRTRPANNAVTATEDHGHIAILLTRRDTFLPRIDLASHSALRYGQ